MIDSDKLESIVFLTGRKMELQKKLMDGHALDNMRKERVLYLIKVMPNTLLMTKREKQKNQISKTTTIEEILKDNPEILNFVEGSNVG